MRSVAILIILNLLLSSCQERLKSNNFDSNKSLPIIYEVDTRQDLEASFRHQNLAEATALMIEIESLKKSPTGHGWILRNYKLKDNFPLCADEKFLEQPTLGFCTGVLIAQDLVLTAGHCLLTQADCKKTKLVFGFNLKKANQYEIPSNEVYGCEQILKREAHESNGVDYAIIQLNRQVEKIKPPHLAKKDSTRVDDFLLSLSYPLGLPLKMDVAKVMLNNTQENTFIVQVNTFSGSSGSPLFNSEGEVVGILSRGMPDFDEDEIHRVQKEGGCLNFNSCKAGACLGEHFFKVDRIRM